jgi:hypothetical protein
MEGYTLMVMVGDGFHDYGQGVFCMDEEELRNEPRLDNTKYHE